MERRTWIARVASLFGSMLAIGPKTAFGMNTRKEMDNVRALLGGLKPLTVKQVDDILDIPYFKDHVTKITIKNRLLEYGHMEAGAVGLPEQQREWRWPGTRKEYESLGDWRAGMNEIIRQVEIERLGDSKVNLSVEGIIFATITTGDDFGTIECPENHIELKP
jgi:hypothetical protein